ncbi:unnamed protein product [Colias eurytheme]|nr:unnamed protein product [Colias eurytheme]
MNFKEKHKVIEGRKINDWIKVGEKVFASFYNLGVQQRWNLFDIQYEEETAAIISLVTQNKDWLESFISLYPNLRMNLDLVCSAADICTTRSGIEVLLRGFVNIDPQFNNILADLESMSEVDEFDRVLKIWIDTGHRPDNFCVDSTIPHTHWWWF